jgi:DNA polymerase-3 subunit delta
MVAHKAASVQRFLNAPDPDCRAVLLYGPDAGLVTMRGATLANLLAGRGGGSAEIVRIDDRDLADDRARLEVELRTVPMFAAAKVVRVTAGARLDVPALKALLETALDARLIVEAGNLKPDSGLRKLFESHKQAAALPCYADERNLAALIDAELAPAQLGVDAETKAYLMTRLGADQALSHAEIVKLALYAAGRGQVTHEDVDAIIGDSAEIAVETFVYAVSGGETKEALRQLDRLAGSGTEASAALSGLARHFLQLHSLAAALAKGGSAEQAVKSLRPRPHFKREPSFIAHSRRWGADRLLDAMPMIQEAVKRSRRFPELEHAFAERLILSLHHKAA